MDEEEMIKNNMGLIYKFSSSYYGKMLKGYNKDEVESEMLISLWKSIRKYNPEIGAFSTYAMRGFELASIDLIRKYKRYERYGTSVISKDYEEYADLSDVPQKEREVYDQDTIDKLHELIRNHPDKREKSVIERIMQGRTHAQISKEFGFSRARSHKIFHRGLARIRRRMKEWMESM